MSELVYIPNKHALHQRKYKLKIAKWNRCNSLICNEQREKSIVPKELKYKLYYVCVRCKTNWPKTMTHCGCCNYTLRKKARKKRGMNEEVKRIE